MKRVTGSNPPQTANRVSIQLALDGHSFSVRFPSGDLPEPVTAEVLTPRTLLVPADALDPERAADLLAAAGLAPLAGECTVCSEPQEGVAAVMAVPEEALRQIAERSGKPVRFTTPLLHRPTKTDATVWLLHTAGLLFIKVYRSDVLRFAEVIPAPAEADIQYLLDRLAGEFPPKEFALHIDAEEPRKLRKIAGNVFKEVVCG